MAFVPPPPQLSQPTTLLTHPTPAPAELARHAALPATAFATSKVSTICVGAAYKLSSDASALRRLKRTLPILVAANALNLVNPQSHTPIQSFTLSSADTASSAPLTLLRSLSGGRSLRTTYLGVQSHARAKSSSAALTPTHQLWAYVEQLSAKRKQSTQVRVNKQSLSLPKPIRLIHALGDGRLVLTHPDDSLTIVSSAPVTFDDQASIHAAATSLQVTHTLEPTHSHAQQRFHFYVNVLDAASAKPLISASSTIEQASLVGLRVAITSDHKTASTSANPDDDSTKKKKRSKRSRNGANHAQADDLLSSSSGFPATVSPSGPLTLELTAFVKSFDGASDSAIVAVQLGSIHVPHYTNARHVLDVQLHPEGRLAILGVDGQLTSMTLTTSSSSEPVLSNINTNYLDALAHPSSARPSSSSTASPACCLLLSRDHALVVGVSQPTRATADKERVVALIIDLELNAVLRHIDWAVPFVPASSAAAATTGLLQRMTTISASRMAGSTSLITIGAPTVASRTSSSSDKAEALTQLHQRRVCVLAVPFVVPQASVLRDALGKRELTARWIRRADDVFADGGSASLCSDASRCELVHHINNIVQRSGKASAKNAETNATISKWIEAATADGRMLDTLTLAEADTQFFGELLDVLLPAAPQRNNNNNNNNSNSSNSNSSNSSSSSSSIFFARSALLTLLRHPRVHASIFGTLRAGLGEFWTRLAAHNDAQLISAALKRMPDIGEDALVWLLSCSLRRMVQSRNGGDGEGSKAVRLWMGLLAQIVELRASRPAVRSALKLQLRDDVDQVVALLQMCNAWMSQTMQRPLEAEESDQEAKRQQTDEDEFVTAAGKVKAPNADATMALANDVLDTFFPLLVATPRSHAAVQSLSSTISRYLQLMSTLRLLNAPLSAFGKLQQENDMVASTARKNRKANTTTLSASGAVASAGNTKVNASSKADGAARAEMGGGLGIKLGTQGEAKTLRLQLVEQSMLVGAYSFERLEI